MVFVLARLQILSPRGYQRVFNSSVKEEFKQNKTNKNKNKQGIVDKVQPKLPEFCAVDGVQCGQILLN